MNRAIARALLWSLVLLLAAQTAPPAAAQSVDEYALRTAFLYNFTRFVDWPPSAFAAADSPFVICVIGSDPFDARLAVLEERRAGARPIQLDYPRDAIGLSRCQIAYFGQGSARRLVDAAQSGRLPNLLSVSSDPAFARRGGLVSLVAEAGRIHVHVNLGAINRSSLHFSAKLLEVARVRHDARRSGDDA